MGNFNTSWLSIGCLQDKSQKSNLNGNLYHRPNGVRHSQNIVPIYPTAMKNTFSASYETFFEINLTLDHKASFTNTKELKYLYVLSGHNGIKLEVKRN